MRFKLLYVFFIVSPMILTACGGGNDTTTSDDGSSIGSNADTGDAVDSDGFPPESADTDGDGLGNNSDNDDDNDGVLDTNDAFPLDASESADTDSDGIGNNADTDDDNDGVLDTIDAFPLNAAESIDTDDDGTGDNADTDDDDDGLSDIKEGIAGSDPLLADRMSINLNDITNGRFNLNHACMSLGGGNQSPAITVNNIPSNATKWALFIEKNNQTCSSNECLQWMVSDIDSNAITLESELDISSISDSYEGSNYTGEANFAGPCVLGDDLYTLKVFALNASTASRAAELFNSDRMEGIYSENILDMVSLELHFDLTQFNSAPTANAGQDKTTVIGSSVTLNSNLSSDPDSDDLTFNWTLVSKPAGSTSVLIDAESSVASFDPDVLGAYEFQLSVSDGVWGSVTDNVIISVKPKIELNFYYSKGVNIEWCGVTVIDGNIEGYRWYNIGCDVYTYAGTKLTLEITNNSSSDVIINTLGIDYPTGGFSFLNNLIGTGLEYLNSNTTKSLVLTVDTTRKITGTIVTIDTDVFGEVSDEWEWFY